MGHQITPDQEDTNIDIGRLVQNEYYKKSRKEVKIENVSLDTIKFDGKELVIGEIKKSSKFLESARMQLLFYLYRLKQNGIIARGELLVPGERKKELVVLDNEKENSLLRIIEDVKSIVSSSLPPAPTKIHFCKKCAYSEFCWA